MGGDGCGTRLLSDPFQGAAWLSSARAVRCRVKSYNERNPAVSCQHVKMGTLTGLPVQTARKVGMTSNHHGPCPGLHTCYNGRYRGQPPARGANLKPVSVRIGSATRPREAGIASNRISAMIRWIRSRPCTHRPSSHGSRGYLKSVTARSCPRVNRWLGLSQQGSRTEGAAGTPPFWEEAEGAFGAYSV